MLWTWIIVLMPMILVAAGATFLAFFSQFILADKPKETWAWLFFSLGVFSFVLAFLWQLREERKKWKAESIEEEGKRKEDERQQKQHELFMSMYPSPKILLPSEEKKSE